MTDGKKEVLLIRHGESVTNATEKFQAGDQFEIDPLNENGNRQAALLAAEFESHGYQPDIILSTAYLRGAETARAIGQVTGRSVIVPLIDRHGQLSEQALDSLDPDGRKSLLRELDLPSELEGRDYADPVAVAVKDEIKAHQYNPDWHYSDEENLHDIWRRAGAVEQYLAGRLEHKVAVFSNGGFIKAVLAHIMFDGQADWSLEQKLQAYRAFTGPSWIDNTGIVSLFQDTDKGGWQWLISYNHHLHSTFGFMNEAPGSTAEASADELRVP